MNIKIDEEFSNLIPCLKEDEFKQLQANIIAEGCRDPLVVWGETSLLLDGHNRFKICTENNIIFKTQLMSFADRDSALTWIIDNQVGRRNLSPIDKVPLVERKREILEEAARKRQIALAGTRPNSDLPENLPEGDTGDTRDKLAASIGVSGKTYESMVKTVNNGNPELVDMVRKKQIGAATAATIAALDKGEQSEILNGGKNAVIQAAKAIQGTKKKEVVVDVKEYMSRINEEEHQYATMAISQLERIRFEKPIALEALKRVAEWVDLAIHRFNEEYHQKR